jgi:hypothetical protein
MSCFCCGSTGVDFVFIFIPRVEAELGGDGKDAAGDVTTREDKDGVSSLATGPNEGIGARPTGKPLAVMILAAFVCGKP